MERITKEKILKEMKGYEEKYRKLTLYEEILKYSLEGVLIVFFATLCLNLYKYSYLCAKIVAIFRILGIFLIILQLVVYKMQSKILQEYLVSSYDTDINLQNKLKYRKKRGVKKITFIGVVKLGDKDYVKVQGRDSSGEYEKILIPMNRAHSYLDIK